MIHYGLVNNNSQTILDNPEPASTLPCQCSSCCNLQSQNQEILSNPSIAGTETEATSTSNISQEIVDSLLSGSQWAGETITYSFYENDVFNGEYYGPETGVEEVSEAVKANVRAILQLLETYTNLNFVEIEETDPTSFGQLRYLLADDPDYAYAYFPSTDPRGGDIFLNSDFQNSSTINGFENGTGEHGFTALIHETLHALGLKHPHEEVPGNDTTLDPNLDNFSNTILSADFTGRSPATPQLYDIAALQQLYGVGEHNQSDDLYVFGNQTDTYTLNGESFFAEASSLQQTIWDTGGNDTLDFSELELESSGYLFDLNQGGQLIANGQARVRDEETFSNFGTALAYGVVIENVIGSASDDTIIANSAANIFSGYQLGTNAGNDTLVGTDSLDTLFLSGYLDSEVSQTRVEQDLVVDLGNDGSILIEDYYTVAESDRLKIQFGDDITEIELNSPSLFTPEAPENFPEPDNSNNPELDLPDSSNIEPLAVEQVAIEQITSEYDQISQFDSDEQIPSPQDDLLAYTYQSAGGSNGFVYQAAQQSTSPAQQFSELDPNTPSFANKIEEDQDLELEIYPIAEQINSLAIAGSQQLRLTSSLDSLNSNISPISLTANNFGFDLMGEESIKTNNFAAQL